jgi:hypothetical protein
VTIWILAILLMGVFASAGSQQGAIRMLIGLAGVFLGAVFALKLDDVVRPLMGVIGVSNPVWKWLLPPVFVFLAFAVGLGMLAQFVHHKVSVYYDFRATDDDRLRWQRLNGKLGLAMGISMGAVYLLIFGLIIYVGGYLTTQLKSPGENPMAINFLNRARADLASTRFDKLIAAIDPTPSSVYDAADIFGLVYNNPDLASRMSQYPLFLAMAEKPQFQDVANDSTYGTMIREQANILTILNHPKTQAILGDKEIVAGFRQADIADLKTFLETGRSPKYESEKIIGRWRLHPAATVQLLRQKYPNLGVPELNKIRDVVLRRMGDLVLIAAPEPLSNLMWRGTQVELAQFDTILSDKQAGLPQLFGSGDVVERPLGSGSWKKTGTNYGFTVKTDNGDQNGTIEIDASGRMTLRLGGNTLVFLRLPD